MVRAVATAGRRSPTSEPVLDVGDEGIEVAETREPFHQAPEVDRGVVVDEDVSEAGETREPGRGGGGEHAMGGEPRRNALRGGEEDSGIRRTLERRSRRRGRLTESAIRWGRALLDARPDLQRRRIDREAWE